VTVRRSSVGATQDEVRRHNLGRVLQYLHVQGPASRADLTKATGLNRSTIGALTSDLVDAELVREGAPIGRGVGRPSIGVAPNSIGVVALAIDLRVERTVVALVGLGGLIVRRTEIDHARDAGPPTARIGRVIDLCRECLDGAPGVCVGIGISIAGVVRNADGLVRLAPNMQWVDVPLAALVADGLGTTLPIHVGNDADLGAIAEHRRGSAAGVSNMIYLSGEVGVGGGIVLDGQAMVGAGGYGGEVGHMVVNPAGRDCRCGRRGCWETEIGEDALLRALRVSRREDLVARLAALQETHDGDVPALRPVARWIGLGLANLVNIFNPEVIVFGDLHRQVLPLVQRRLRDTFDFALAAPREQVRLSLPGLGSDSTLLGAAELAFAPLLDDPLAVIGRFRAAIAA
jgi:predicted NBD/HSP70 family sugar kinase